MNDYIVLSKQSLSYFPLQQSPKRMLPLEPDLLLEMTFSPKLFIIDDIAAKVEAVVQYGVEWLDARVDCSPSQPSEDEILVYENFRMPYIHQTYRLTNQEKQYGKLNWLDIQSADFQWDRLQDIPLEQRLIFKLEEDFGIVMVHQTVIDLLKQHVKDVWIRNV